MMIIMQWYWLFRSMKFRLLLILISLQCVFFFVLRSPSNRVNSDRTSLDFFAREKVLVPVDINRLYDHQVVCSKKTDDHSINQVLKSCQIHFNGSLKINLQPPSDFHIRSLLTTKYIKSWGTNQSCSLYQNETIAIVISYRDRERNLQILLHNLIPLLQKQQIFNYKIFIIEQQASGAFNKGRLYNIAFNHLAKTYGPTCVIFHDVDLIPENDQNLYSCYELTDHPFHMSANVRFDTNGSYTTIYPFLVGGVLAIRPQTFIRLNGYSNEYFNWGGEDDDLGLRFLSKDICVQRPMHGYYYAHAHPKQTRNTNRFKLLSDAVLRQDTDGLTNIDQLAVITKVDEYPLVTWMTVKWTDLISV